MLSKKGKYLLMIIMITTSNLIYSQQNEFGFLADYGISEVYKEKYHKSKKYPKIYSRSFDFGFYFKKRIKRNVFFKIELTYNEFRDHYQFGNRSIYEWQLVSTDPRRGEYVKIGELILGETKVDYQGINFPISLGYERGRWFAEIGYGGSVRREFHRYEYRQKIIGNKEEIYESDRQGNLYTFVDHLFKASVGMRIFEALSIKMSILESFKNEGFERLYSQYIIGFEYRILR